MKSLRSTPIIEIEPAPPDTSILECNGCHERPVFASLITGSKFGNGSRTSQFRMCRACLLKFRGEVISKIEVVAGEAVFR
jgi:hypothetical protein